DRDTARSTNSPAGPEESAGGTRREAGSGGSAVSRLPSGTSRPGLRSVRGGFLGPVASGPDQADGHLVQQLRVAEGERVLSLREARRTRRRRPRRGGQRRRGCGGDGAVESAHPVRA